MALGLGSRMSHSCGCVIADLETPPPTLDIALLLQFGCVDDDHDDMMRAHIYIRVCSMRRLS